MPKLIFCYILCALLSIDSLGSAAVYQLESIKIVGTERLTDEFMASELNLTPGIKLDDELVMSVRENLMGLGLFKSVLLYMKKGKRRGQAKLIIEAED